jgi:hypothetical protein
VELEEIHGKTQRKVFEIYSSALSPAKFLLYRSIERVFKE